MPKLKKRIKRIDPLVKLRGMRENPFEKLSPARATLLKKRKSFVKDGEALAKKYGFSSFCFLGQIETKELIHSFVSNNGDRRHQCFLAMSFLRELSEKNANPT